MLACALLLTIGSVAGEARPLRAGGAPAFEPAVAAELQTAIQDARTDLTIPGISAAVRLGDGSDWTGVTGRGEVGRDGWALADDTPFVAASITKTFVAATILQLAEEGALSIDDPLARWLPDWPRASRITLRHLLQHTSGEANYFEHPSYESLVHGRPAHIWTVDEILALVDRPRFAPGTDWEYSNTNFVLLGLVIEGATGGTVSGAIRSRFLDPLGLSDTWFQGEEQVPVALAKGYWRNGDLWRAWDFGTVMRPNDSAATVAWAAAAMVSTPRDLAVWAQALFGGRVLSPTSVAQMVEFNEEDYGLGARGYVLGGRTAWGHGGSLRGFEAAMRYVPWLDASVVVMWNRGLVDPKELAQQLGAITFRHLYPDTTAPITSSPRPYITQQVVLEAGTVPLRLRWGAMETESGVAAYELNQSKGAGPWDGIPLADPDRPSIDLVLPTRQTFAFSLRATDAEGNVGPWTDAVPFRARIIQERNPSLARSPEWSSRSVAGALGGAVLMTDVEGAEATLSFEGLGVAWVASRSPNRGEAGWSLDGAVPRVANLHAPRTERRWIAGRAAWEQTGAHQLVIAALGTAGRPRIDLDAIILLQAVP